MSFAVNTDTIEHFSSRGGIRTKDDTTTIEVNRTGTMRIDDMSMENLGLFFFGDPQVQSVAAVASATEVIAGANVKKGRSYQLGVDAALRPTGYRNVSITSVALTGAPGTTYPATAGGVTNWEIDAARGFFTIGESSAIADSAGITVTYSVAAHSRRMVISGNTEKAFSMQFHAYNPKGQLIDYFFPFVKIRPNGDLQLISEEYMEVEFQVEVLGLGSYAPVYMNGQPYT